MFAVLAGSPAFAVALVPAPELNRIAFQLFSHRSSRGPSAVTEGRLC
jgi:hypothetical protein